MKSPLYRRTLKVEGITNEFRIIFGEHIKVLRAVSRSYIVM